MGRAPWGQRIEEAAHRGGIVEAAHRGLPLARGAAWGRRRARRRCHFRSKKNPLLARSRWRRPLLFRDKSALRNRGHSRQTRALAASADSRPRRRTYELRASGAMGDEEEGDVKKYVYEGARAEGVLTSITAGEEPKVLTKELPLLGPRHGDGVGTFPSGG